MSDAHNRPVDAATRYCAVLGHPIQHSASPAMQNAGIVALGLNWRYLGFDVHPDDLRAAVAGAKAMKFIGLNLTVPHKLLAVDLVDVLDESAKGWGAVNTIRFEAPGENGDWTPLAELPADRISGVRAKGFNTDADGIARALREDLGIELRGARVLLLGAGGAGRVAALKIAADGAAELHVVNRTLARAEAIVAEIRSRFPAVQVQAGYPEGSVDLLLNATSLGLKRDDPLPLDEKRFPLRKARAVYDMIYRPAETPLLRAARVAGCRAANGLAMLLYQGARALEIWSGESAPIEVMRRALEQSVYV
ncbi:MAG: shikimate dehydrogenase family protein [Limisphaerales bacterium]